MCFKGAQIKYTRKEEDFLVVLEYATFPPHVDVITLLGQLSGFGSASSGLLPRDEIRVCSVSKGQDTYSLGEGPSA